MNIETPLKKTVLTGPVYRNVKISDFMSTWLTKTGYPVVDVVKLNNRKYRLSQTRFVNKPNFQDQKILKKRWPVLYSVLKVENDVIKFK